MSITAARVRSIPGLFLGFAAALLISPSLIAQTEAEPWWANPVGPGYQILVYAFADSDGDGFGDLKGIIENLDYLNDGKAGTGNDLGVQAIWLSPINNAVSYHGYDVTDYKSVSSRVGSMEDFEKLVAEAHKRGIKVILDMVFNHTSRSHVWFTNFIKDPNGRYGNYYVRRKEGVGYSSAGYGKFYKYATNDVQYFSAFGEGMPDLNCENTDVVNELKDILSFWIKKGADGFRFDAAKHIFDPNEMAQGTPTMAMTRMFWNDLRKHARSEKADVIMVGEVLSTSTVDLAAYSKTMDSLFDFASAQAIVGAAAGLNSSNFNTSFERIQNSLLKTKGFVPSPILTNHDQDRAMSLFLMRSALASTDGWGEKSSDIDDVKAAKKMALTRGKMAASLLLTLPGLPFLYYGEELGMTGKRYLNDDVARRDAFIWKSDRKAKPNVTWMIGSSKLEAGQNKDTPALEAQLADPNSLAAHYVLLGALRQKAPALQGGSWKQLVLPEDESLSVISYLREGKGQKLLVQHNMSEEDATLKVMSGYSIKAFFDSSQALSGKAFAPKDSKILAAGDSYSLAPYASAVFEILKAPAAE